MRFGASTPPPGARKRDPCRMTTRCALSQMVGRWSWHDPACPDFDLPARTPDSPNGAWGITLKLSGSQKASPFGCPLERPVRPGEQRDDRRASPTYNGAGILLATPPGG